MKNMQITIGRSGRVWPEVLRAVRICRGEGRRAVLYVPEQVTLQTERNLIADLELRGLLDIEVVSPKKLRELVRERAGSGNRKTLDECGQAMAVHRAMSETAGELTERLSELGARLLGCDVCQSACPANAALLGGSALSVPLKDLLCGELGALPDIIGTNYARKRRLRKKAALLSANLHRTDLAKELEDMAQSPDPGEAGAAKRALMRLKEET